MTAPRVLALAVVLVTSALSASPALARSTKPRPNTGKPGSTCKRVALRGPDPGPGTGLDTTSLGPAAPAPYEIGAPTSDPEWGEPVRRVMMLVHGGAWFTVGRKAMRSQRDIATKWRAAGWQTVSISYRACRKSLGDVVRFYDLIRSRVGPEVPICMRGESAGGHLALLAATRRPDLACVIALASPTDLRSLRAQGRIEAASGTAPPQLRAGAARAANLAVAAFGRRNQRARSPAAFGSRIGARILLATAVNDVVIPQGQASALANAIAATRSGNYVDVVRLEAGSSAFVHGSASTSATHDFDARSATLVGPFGRAPEDAGPPLEMPPANPLGDILNSIFGLFRPPPRR